MPNAAGHVLPATGPFMLWGGAFFFFFRQVASVTLFYSCGKLEKGVKTAVSLTV